MSFEDKTHKIEDLQAEFDKGWKQRAEKAMQSLLAENNAFRERAEKAERLADSLARELVSHREKAQGNYWAWDSEYPNNVESLVCPILIHPRDMLAVLDGREKAEAACAEMRRHIETWTNYYNSMAGVDRDNSRRQALSSDCGKDYFHKSELTPLVKALRYAASVRTDRASVEDGVCMCSQTADWCSGLIDALDEAAPIVERLESLRKDAK